ncbi:cytochrome P450 2J4-like [Paramacrobiotus metropolitanus]|uniref:cytochrome P450 2J4-like n=1 Tax=Paramacrobiotus metropolitanus TaxID=2943436 RepID=UPI0024461BC3|nr:cytochrome P450 2J4-like [Paramacrobiotus metropolitanus]
MLLYLGIIAAGLLAYLLRKWFYCIWARYVVKSIPGGPFPLPIVGNILEIDGKAPFESMEKWAHQYGKLFTMMMGSEVVLAIADLDLLKKAFKDDRFSGRPENFFFDIWRSMGYPLGFAGLDGDVWKEHRRFSIHALKDFGFGKSAAEEQIQKEAGELLKTLLDSGGQPMDNHIPFSTATSNVTAIMMFGTSFSSQDSRFNYFIEAESQNFKDFANMSVLDMIPWAVHIPPFRSWVKNLRKRIEKQLELLHELISEHKQYFDPQNPRDYIDAFFNEKDKSATFTDGQLLSNVQDLFSASFETTATFLRWAMLLMIHHPEAQRKVQEEIDRVIGRSGLIKSNDRSRLPYTEATILEIFRFANYIPFLLPHKTLEDVQFEGYTIRKDTTIMGLGWVINRDPALWKNPEAFIPERFLDDKGNVNQSTASNVMIFSTGKRVCPGEPLARIETLLFFGSILQKFNITGEGSAKPSLSRVDGLTLTPEPYLMRAIPRK